MQQAFNVKAENNPIPFCMALEHAIAPELQQGVLRGVHRIWGLAEKYTKELNKFGKLFALLRGSLPDWLFFGTLLNGVVVHLALEFFSKRDAPRFLRLHRLDELLEIDGHFRKQRHRRSHCVAAAQLLQ